MAVMTFKEFVDRAYLEERREKPLPLSRLGYYRMLRFAVEGFSESYSYRISYTEASETERHRVTYDLAVGSETIAAKFNYARCTEGLGAGWCKVHGEFLCALALLIKNLEEGYAEYLEEEKSKHATLASEFTQTMGPTLYTHDQGRVAHEGYWVSFENNAITNIEPIDPLHPPSPPPVS